MEHNQTIITHGVAFDFQRINVTAGGGMEAVFFAQINGAFHSCHKVELSDTAGLAGNFDVSFKGNIVGNGRDVLEAVVRVARMTDFENSI